MHITQRGHNRTDTFLDAWDRAAYLGYLRDASERERCAINAYVLMSNHTHLLVTPSTATAASRMMQQLGRRYVRCFNRRHRRSGTLWEDRFHSTIVDSSRYLIACSRYIDLNPVRAGMVHLPEAHEWSSYACLALGQVDELVTPHPEYVALGSTPASRQREYRRLCGVQSANRGTHTSSASGELLDRSVLLQVMAVALQRPEILPTPPRGRATDDASSPARSA